MQPCRNAELAQALIEEPEDSAEKLCREAAGSDDPDVIRAVKALGWADMLDQTHDEKRIKDVALSFLRIPWIFREISEGEFTPDDVIKWFIAAGFIEAPRYLVLRGKRTRQDIAIITTMVLYRRSVLLLDPELQGETVRHFGFGKRWRFDAKGKARLRERSKATRVHAFKYIDAVPSGHTWPRQTWDVANRDLKELERICAELKKLKYRPCDGPNRALSPFENHYANFMRVMGAVDSTFMFGRKAAEHAKRIFYSNPDHL